MVTQVQTTHAMFFTEEKTPENQMHVKLPIRSFHVCFPHGLEGLLPPSKNIPLSASAEINCECVIETVNVS